MKVEIKVMARALDGPPRDQCSLQYEFDDAVEHILVTVAVPAQQDEAATRTAALAKAKSFARKFYENATLD